MPKRFGRTWGRTVGGVRMSVAEFVDADRLEISIDRAVAVGVGAIRPVVDITDGDVHMIRECLTIYNGINIDLSMGQDVLSRHVREIADAVLIGRHVCIYLSPSECEGEGKLDVVVRLLRDSYALSDATIINRRRNFAPYIYTNTGANMVPGLFDEVYCDMLDTNLPRRGGGSIVKPGRVVCTGGHVPKREEFLSRAREYNSKGGYCGYVLPSMPDRESLDVIFGSRVPVEVDFGPFEDRCNLAAFMADLSDKVITSRGILERFPES